MLNMKLIKKKEMFKQLLNKNNNFICPICQLELKEYNDSLMCENKHTFDINKKGFCSLLKKQKNFSSDIYTKELFLNRRYVLEHLLYKDVYNIIAKFINKTSKDTINIFELGSGESTHSYFIKKLININNNYCVSDLSKEAIEMSSDYLKDELLPIICDAYNLPIKNNSVDYVIDILSPFNNKEIKRILKKDGYFIKVFPERNYLKELRKLINLKDYDKEDEVFENFAKNFEIVEIKDINYTLNLSQELSKAIIKMTPMTNNHETQTNLTEITINLKVIIAKNKSPK